MTTEARPFCLTAQDKQKYIEQIETIDLSTKQDILEKVPSKLNLLSEKKDINVFEAEVLEGVSILYSLLKTRPEINEMVQKKIIFALNYFIESKDEVPDSYEGIGFMDDAAVVLWIIEDIQFKYQQYFDA